MATFNIDVVSTRHGVISVKHSHPAKPSKPALLCIHGNSTSSNIFKHVFDSVLSEERIILAPDLPGHGASSNAPSPPNTYTQAGYAEAMAEILAHYSIEDYIIFGWSLGGHIGIEMLPRSDSRTRGPRGLMITGTPPVPRGQVRLGFKGDGHMNMAFREVLTDEEKRRFAHGTAGLPYEDWLLENVNRTDPCARRLMYEAFSGGVGVDQQEAIRQTKVLTAVVNGAVEPFVKLDFISGIKYGNLWKGECIELHRLGHAPFWENPEDFHKILRDFVEDASR